MAVATDELEREIHDVARALAGRGARRPLAERLDRVLIDRVLADPRLKTQLFRLVDVYPAIGDDRDLVRHLREHLERPYVPLPLRALVRAAGRAPGGGRAARAATAFGISRMAGRFIAGADAPSIVPLVERMWRDGAGAIVDLLGEKTVTDGDADRYAGRLTEHLAVLTAAAASWPHDPRLERDRHGPVPRLSLAVKATALAPTFRPRTAERGLEGVLGRLLPVLEQTRDAGVTVWIDMEHHEVKDLTFELARRLLADPRAAGLHLGVVVQAYLRSAEDDLAGVLAMAAGRTPPVGVRLVKGAYWDVEVAQASTNGWPVPVWERKGDTDACFERCTRILLDHAGAVRPAVASHNLRSVAHAIAHARAVGLPAGAVEYQVLYGMGTELLAALVATGQRARAYTPVGPLVPGMAYLVRRLLENTANESFVRQRLDHDLERLLAPPDRSGDPRT